MRIAALAVEPFKKFATWCRIAAVLFILWRRLQLGHPCSLGAGMVAINIGLWEVVSLEQKGLFECL
jgi:hypothetical protein